MSLTIEWLLNQPQKGYQCVAGQAGIKNSITGINIMDNPDSVPWLKKDELVLSTGYLFSSTTIYKSIIRDLHRQGCSGLGIKMNRYIDQLPDEMINQANELGFPIFSIPFSSTMEEIVNLVYYEMFRNDLSKEEAWIIIYKDIMKSALEKQDISDVIEKMSDALKLPCFYTTANLQLIDCHYPSNSHENSLSFLKDSNYLFSDSDRQNIIMTPGNLKKPVIEHSVKYDNDLYNYYIYPLFWDNQINGFFVCLCVNKSISMYQHDMINNLKSIFDIFAIKNQKSSSVNAASHNTFYQRILSNSITSPDEIELECKHFGFDFSHKRVCLVIESPNYKNLSIVNQRTYLNKMDAIFQKFAAEHCFTFHYTVYDNELVIFIYPNENLDKLTSEVIRELSEYIEKDFVQLEAGCLFGYSRFNSGTHTIYSSFQEAQKSIKIGSKLSPEGSSFLYYDYLTYNILLSTMTTAQLYDYYASNLKPLEEYDERNNACLLYTLENYILCNLNISQTAKKLFIHRNTMIRRMEQIKELLPLDIKNPDHIYLIQTALYAKKLLD